MIADEKSLQDLLSTFCDDVIPKNDVDYTVPETIQNYRKTIESNKEVSIFDADYCTPNDLDDHPENACSTSSSSNSGTNNNTFPKDENLTYVLSGRGRGGRNTVYKPGESINNSIESDDITQQIRKLHVLGYSNEITELSVKAHQLSKKSNQGSTTSNSPITLSNNTNSSSPEMFADVESSETSKENLVEETPEPKPAPPLSVLLRQAREDVKNRKAKQAMKELNGSPAKNQKILKEKNESPVSRTSSSMLNVSPPNSFLFVTNDSKPINISSEEEFPPL